MSLLPVQRVCVSYVKKCFEGQFFGEVPLLGNDACESVNPLSTCNEVPWVLRTKSSILDKLVLS